MEVMPSSPWRSAPDSPSRQLLLELSQLAISAQERFQARQERENNDRAVNHRNALAAAAIEHERIRRGAEIEREKLDHQIRLERQRREDEAQKELETQRQQDVEREAAERRRKVERATEAEAQRKKAEQAKIAESKERETLEAERLEKEALEKSEVDAQRREAEVAKRSHQTQEAMKNRGDQAQAAEARVKEAIVAAQGSRAQNAPENAATTQQATTTSRRNPEREAAHQKYVEIHQRLKDMRRFMTNGAKRNPDLKRCMGDMRREIKKSVGQLRDERGANKQPVSVTISTSSNPILRSYLQLASILSTLRNAMSMSDPKVDITLFLASPPPQASDRDVPALLAYLLNIFAKAIIAQLIDEAGVKPKAADPVGIVATHIFAMDHFRWNGTFLIDILLAKLHVVCPVLFGIYGSERTEEGKARLGWWREEPNGPFITEQRHNERMTGLGAGFAALSLRNFEKSRWANPYPENNYWQAMAAITNVPPNELTQTHFVVLKAMIENYETKFVSFFGDAAIAALRHALVELPGRSLPSVAVKALAGLVDVLKKDKKLTL